MAKKKTKSTSAPKATKKSTKQPIKKTPSKRTPLVKGTIVEERVLTENSDAARAFHEKSALGTIERNKIMLTFIEAFYLMQKEKLEIVDTRGNALSEEKVLRKARKQEPNFWIRFAVFRDLRDRGYIVKTALKFGADFRVYGRGIKPGEDHAKWIVYPVHEGSTLTWHDFSAKNRVAHSTKKRLLIGIVDEESDVTYYKISWIRP